MNAFSRVGRKHQYLFGEEPDEDTIVHDKRMTGVKNYTIIMDPDDMGFCRGAKFSTIEVTFMLESCAFTVGTVVRCPYGKYRQVVNSTRNNHQRFVMAKPTGWD